MGRRFASLAAFALALSCWLPRAVSAETSAIGASEVVGADAKVLLKRPTSSFRAYAFGPEGPRPIPFQVDERDRKGHWADDQGPAPVRDDSPGVFDENDVVVFLNRDLGVRGDAKKLPAGARSWVEARIGPKQHPLGYAYVGSFDSPPPLPSDARDSCRYDAAADQVFGERYTVRFGAPLPTYLGLVDRPGDMGTNLLYGVRVFGEARILAGLFHFERSEKDLEYRIQGWRDGPVRVIRSAKYWIPLPLGFKARARSELLFYGDFVEARNKVNIKIPPRFVPADGSMTAHLDFRDQTGARIVGPPGVMAEPIDGRMTDAKRAFTQPHVRWSALLLPSGRTLLLAVRLEDSLAKLDQQLYLDDSDDAASGKPAFGFRLAGVNRLETGEQELAVSAMILDGTSPQRAADAASLLLDTPEVSLTQLAPSTEPGIRGGEPALRSAPPKP